MGLGFVFLSFFLQDFLSLFCNRSPQFRCDHCRKEVKKKPVLVPVSYCGSTGGALLLYRVQLSSGFVAVQSTVVFRVFIEFYNRHARTA